MSLTRGMPVGTRRKKSGAGSVIVDQDILEDSALEDGEYVSPPPINEPDPREIIERVNPASHAAAGGGAVITALNDEMSSANAAVGGGGSRAATSRRAARPARGGFSPAATNHDEGAEHLRDEGPEDGAVFDDDTAHQDQDWVEMSERYDATKASRRPGSAAAKYRTRKLEVADPKPPAKAPVEKAVNRKAVMIAVSASIVVIAIILIIVFVMSSNDDDDGDDGSDDSSGRNAGASGGGGGLGNTSYAQPSAYLPGIQLYPAELPGSQSIVSYSTAELNNTFGQPSSYSASGWEMSCPWTVYNFSSADNTGTTGTADTVVDSSFFSNGISSRQHKQGQTFPSPTRSWLKHYVELLLSYGPRVPARNTDTPETVYSSGWGKAFQMLSSMLRCRDLPFGSSAGGLWKNHANSITGKGLKWRGFWDVWYSGPFEEVVYRAGTIPEFTSRFTNLVAELNPTLIATADGMPLPSIVNQETKGHILLAAHWDTKWFASNPDPPFVGASDSAVPCVMILELMRRLATKAAVEMLKKHEGSSFVQEMPKVTIVFFDGEESFFQWLYEDHTYGSRYMAKAWNKVDPTFTNITKFILLDLIAPSTPTFRNFFSATTSDYLKMKSIESERRANGLRLGEYSHVYFPGTSTLSTNLIDDDHRPFQDRGLDRILHLIASPFPSTWHTTRDNAASVNYDTVEELVEIFWSYLDGF